MDVDVLFERASSVALAGWLSLFVGLLAGGLRQRHAGLDRLARASLFLGGRALPALLAVGYAAAIARWFGAAPGGFDSLQAVERLFETRGLVLAGWLHFLAFDLWVGRWQIDRLDAALGQGAHRLRDRRAWAWRLATLPCLFCTFMLGPVGLLMFLALEAALRGWRPRPVAP